MRAPSLPAPGSCRGQSSAGPFPDQLSFEFRQSREDREDQLFAGRRRVDAGPLAGEHPDPDVPVVEVLHQVDEMAEIATEAIEPPDDDHVSLSRRLEEGGESRAVRTLSGRLVLVDRVVADAGLAQSIHLQVEGTQDLQTKVIIALFGLFAEVERDLISERTKEGLAAARAKGRRLGRPKGARGKPKLDGQEEEIRLLLQKQVSKASIAKILGVSRTALHLADLSRRTPGHPLSLVNSHVSRIGPQPSRARSGAANP